MSKNNTINLEKNGLEKEKISYKEISINNNELPIPENSEKDLIQNPVYLKGNSFDNTCVEKNSKLSNPQYKKLNSENITGYNSLKNKKFIVNSEQERYNIIKKKLSERNNNMNQRVKIFVPAKEYLDLLEDIDAEEDEDINSISNDKDINGKSEEEKLGKIFDDKIFNDEINNIKEKTSNGNSNNDMKFSMGNKYDEIYSMPKFDLKNEKYLDEKKNIFNRENQNLIRRREIKYLKDFEEHFNISITEVLFKYGDYDKNINKYQKCILYLNNNYLYVLKQSCLQQQDISNALINFNKKEKIDLSFPLLCINFNLSSCILLINKNKETKEFQIKLLGTNQTFSFIITNEKEFNKHIYLIKGMINNSEGFKKNQLSLPLRNKNFYEEIYITPLVFETNAKTGDLLLFQSRDTLANFQRLYTCDNYDHVGIIIKENNKIKIFESTSIGKCSLLSWTHFKILHFNLVYKKMAFRALIYEDKNAQKDVEEKCKTFLKEIEGKNYYLSITRFLCCQKPEKYEYDKNFEKSEGFCCSALASAMYIKIGVAKLQKSVHSVKPGDFEQKRNKIYFEKGFSLGPEQIIDFSE